MAEPARAGIQPIIGQTQVPAGVLGPEPVTLEVRCFLVASGDGIVVVDVGVPGTADAIASALGNVGAVWSDVTDIVLTHAHFDHIGGLEDAMARAPQATVSAGQLDVPAIPTQGGRPVRALLEGDRVRDLEVLATPGHTPGHISLLHGSASAILIGDLVGSVERALSFGPPAFTADAERNRASLSRVAGLGVDRLLFSHGPEVADPNEAIRRLLRTSE